MNPDSSDDMLASGQSLDSRFTLLRPLGKGGMGEVWLVRDGDLREELVAKIVPRGASDDLLALLQRECRHARRLRHPNIVQVFDFHRGDDHGFVTMAFVDGEPLGRLAERPAAEILPTVIQIADALTYAHGQGVVHRDLKAANVLLDAEGRPHLLDFGIAGLSPGVEDVALTGGGSRHSVSPQQLDGQPAQPADDVYALGVLIHELITGRPPFWPDFKGHDIRSTEPGPMVSNHAVPPRLDTLVASMLRKDPAERPANMSEVRRELEAIRSELTAAARPEPRRTAPPLLTPPPKVDQAPPMEPPGTIRPQASPRQTPPTDAANGRRSPLWITTAIFGLLAVTVMAVFLFLPDWVRSKQKTGPGAPSVAAAILEPSATADGTGEGVASATEPTGEAVPIEPAEAVAALATEPAAPVRETMPERPEPTKPPPPQPERRQAGEFERAMSEGLAALDRADYAAAREAFIRAASLRPDAPQSADGLVRADTGLRLISINRLRDEARAFETEEDWQSAAKRYEEVLGLDSTIEFALAGRDHSRARAELSTSLDLHVAKPARMSSEQVLQEASSVLGEATAIEPAGPRLRRQLADLTAAIRAYSTPVRATFESDNLTEVVIYRVGKLGTFDRRALDLRPGSYTVVGSRRGYRDVRQELVIEPGVEPAPLTVRCQEAI